MKKFLLVAGAVIFLAGCGVSELSVNIPRPMEEGNDGRIQQYLEENILDSEGAVCNFEWLHQPGANVVEVWALCEEFMLDTLGTEVEKGEGVSLPVKITFANPSLHVIPEDGSGYGESIRKSFSKIAVVKIKNTDRDIAALEEKNLARAKEWLLGEK